VLVFFQGLGIVKQRYRNVCCALTDLRDEMSWLQPHEARTENAQEYSLM
jgi:hypothetical protein